MQSPQSSWAKIIEAVCSPLGFYALALLIVEGFLALVLTFANLSDTAREYGMWAGISLFLLVFIVVSLLSWFKPQNLTFAEHGHLVHNGKIPYGTEKEQVQREELDKATKLEAPKPKRQD
jgi:hypothetical protein